MTPPEKSPDEKIKVCPLGKGDYPSCCGLSCDYFRLADVCCKILYHGLASGCGERDVISEKKLPFYPTPASFKIKGLADEHPAQKDFNEFMQSKQKSSELGELCEIIRDEAKLGFQGEAMISKKILTLILKRNVNKINILQQTRDKTTRFENIREELADTLLLGGIEELEEANVEIRKCLSILQGDKNDPK